MVISLRLSETDAELVKQCASRKGQTVSSFIREMILDRIELDYEEIIREVEVMKKN